MAYADKRAGQRLESMDARFASWTRRYPGSWDAATTAAVCTRAARLEADVCRAAGIRPGRGPPAALDRFRAPLRPAEPPGRRVAPRHDAHPAAVRLRRRRPRRAAGSSTGSRRALAGRDGVAARALGRSGRSRRRPVRSPRSSASGSPRPARCSAAARWRSSPTRARWSGATTRAIRSSSRSGCWRRATRSSSSRRPSRTPRAPVPARLADAVKAAGGAVRRARWRRGRPRSGRGSRARPASAASASRRARRASSPTASAPASPTATSNAAT